MISRIRRSIAESSLLTFLILMLLLQTSAFASFFYTKENEPALLSIGGGIFDGGSSHFGGLFQLEYKWDHYMGCELRPQCGLAIPEMRSLLLYAGFGVEVYVTKHFVMTPSFSPGLYFRGKNGKDLGFPIEFRSAVEFAFASHQRRLGCQIFHVSNAHFGHHNPGANAFVFFLAFPL